MGGKDKPKKAKATKNNVKIGALICAGVAVIIGAVISSIFVINGQNSKEVEEQTAIYDSNVEVAEKINGKIDEVAKAADEASAKDVGNDRSKIEEINKKKEELLEYRIAIGEEKPTGVNELKEENARLKEALCKVDERLGDLSQEEMFDYELGEDSVITVISNQVSALAGEIDVLANQQAERKAAEERKQKILSGDLSAFAGAYVSDGQCTLVISADKFEVKYSGGSSVSYPVSSMQEIREDSDGYMFVIIKQDRISVTGYTKTFEDGFLISKDGREVYFRQDLGVDVFRKLQ